METHILVILTLVVLAALTVLAGIGGYILGYAEEHKASEGFVGSFVAAGYVGWVSTSIAAFLWFWYIVIHFVTKFW